MNLDAMMKLVSLNVEEKTAAVVVVLPVKVDAVASMTMRSAIFVQMTEVSMQR